MPSAPDSMVDTTAGFLKSKRGVQQALYVLISYGNLPNYRRDKRAGERGGGKERDGEKEANRSLHPRHMAADEMQTITTDKWSDDVWGISSSQDPVTQLFFYFGRNDHWVAERTRDEVIELRGQKPGGPMMTVCEEGIPHAFCLSEYFPF